MIAMGILIVLGVLILAEFQTKRIVAPINEMDPDDPKAGEVYDELAPPMYFMWTRIWWVRPVSRRIIRSEVPVSGW